MERRYIITGGGTSGHINPALAIADLLKQDAAKNGDECKIIFTGSARNDRIPQPGIYLLKGLKGRIYRQSRKEQHVRSYQGGIQKDAGYRS